MGGLDVCPASSPWQRAGDYFRCCEGSGLMRVSVLLVTLSARPPLPRRFLAPGPCARRDPPLQGREGAVRRMPLARAGVTERTRDAPRSRDRAWGPRRAPPFQPWLQRGGRIPSPGKGVCVGGESSLSSAHSAVFGCGFLQV